MDEKYFSILLDRKYQGPVLLASAVGGVNIEDISHSNPSAIKVLPINILEDFTKPLSLSFRLFGNVLADEIVVSVLCLLVPLIIPLPVMALGIFASSVQALVFATLSAAYITEIIE